MLGPFAWYFSGHWLQRLNSWVGVIWIFSNGCFACVVSKWKIPAGVCCVGLRRLDSLMVFHDRNWVVARNNVVALLVLFPNEKYSGRCLLLLLCLSRFYVLLWRASWTNMQPTFCFKWLPLSYDQVQVVTASLTSHIIILHVAVELMGKYSKEFESCSNFFNTWKYILAVNCISHHLHFEKHLVRTYMI